MAAKTKTVDAQAPAAVSATAAAVKRGKPELDIFRQEFDLRRGMIEAMLPARVSWEKFRATVISAVAYNPKLLECSRPSLFKACIEAADFGYSVSPLRGECAIVPVWNSKKRGTDAQCRPMYRGLMKQARASGEIVNIWAHVVREGDKFAYHLGLHKDLLHEPAMRGGGAVTHAYCCWKLKDGTVDFEVMTSDELEKSRGRSDSWKSRPESSPWTTDYEEMCRKSVVRRASKYMPQSDSFSLAVALDERREVGEEVSIDPETGEAVGEPMDVTAEDAGASTPSQTSTGNGQKSKLALFEAKQQQKSAQAVATGPAGAADSGKVIEGDSAVVAGGFAPRVPQGADADQWEAFCNEAEAYIKQAQTEAQVDQWNAVMTRHGASVAFMLPERSQTMTQLYEQAKARVNG